jgi:hypothetical protein
MATLSRCLPESNGPGQQQIDKLLSLIVVQKIANSDYCFGGFIDRMLSAVHSAFQSLRTSSSVAMPSSSNVTNAVVVRFSSRSR